MFELVKHKWKESIRSSIWEKSLALKIVYSVFALYFLIIFLFLGIFLDRILMEGLFPDENPVIKLNEFLLYFFIFDLFLRFLLQSLPTISIQPYLHLPIKRNVIMHYLSLKSMLHPLNFLYFVIFIPFSIKAVAYIYKPSDAIVWLLMLQFLLWFNSSLISNIKRQFSVRPLIALALLLFLVILIGLDYFSLLPISKFFSKLFTSIITNNILLIIPVILFISMYFINFYYLKRSAYIENLAKNSGSKKVNTSDFGFINRFGTIGELIKLELKLMFRNKRPKTIIYLTPLFLLYGLFFYPQEIYMNMGGMLIFVGIFITGGFMMSYGNYLISWESCYFDALLTKNFDFSNYLRAKYWLLFFVTVVSYLFSLLYGFFDIKLLYTHTACFLFNLGFNINIVLYFAINNKKYLDLSKGSTFNYQGVGLSNFVIILPMMVLPVIIYAAFGVFGLPFTGLIVLSSIGILGIIFNNSIQKAIFKRFYVKKYEMAEGFRQR